MPEHRFGPFVLDTRTRQLLRDGRSVHISPKAFCLLELLVATRPRAWSKPELFDQLWPDVEVVEANLANLVAELRRALLDDARHARFIRTLPRFGYAFAASAPAGRAEGGAPVNCRLSWTGGSVLLTAGEHLIGRDADAGVMIDEPSVSRRHALVSVSPAAVTYEDLGSKNGSFREGRRLDGAVRLHDADVVRVGLVDVRFTTLAAPRSTQTQAAS